MPEAAPGDPTADQPADQPPADLIAALDPATLLRALPPWMAAQIRPEAGDAGLPARAEAAVAAVIAAVEAEGAAAGAAGAALQAARDLQDSFVAAGSGWRLFPADPLARRISRAFMPLLLRTPDDGPPIQGTDHLDRFLSAGPPRRMIVCNHLSYTDTQATDALLAAAGYAQADRLVAIAGPKVYTDPWRRVAAISLNTRKTPQSGAVTAGSPEAELPPRELVRLALEAISDCARLMDEGWIVLLYPEGTRSRDGRLQPWLRAAARYCAMPDLQILPLAQTGTDRVFPRDESGMYPGAVRLRFGPALRPAEGRTGGLEQARAALIALLPDGARPDPDAPALR